MLSEILVEIVLVLIWDFHVTFPLINMPKNVVTVSLFRVMPSMNSSEIFPFCFININKEFICFKPSRGTF